MPPEPQKLLVLGGAAPLKRPHIIIRGPHAHVQGASLKAWGHVLAVFLNPGAVRLRSARLRHAS